MGQQMDENCIEKYSHEIQIVSFMRVCVQLKTKRYSLRVSICYNIGSY